MEDLVLRIYVYCTDFIINLANLTGSSYYEINLFVFCILYPLLFIVSILLYLYQRMRHGKLRRNIL